MKARLLMIPAVVLLIAADNPPDPLSKKDLHRLQGTWTLVSAIQDGKALAEDKVMKTTIVFKDDTFRFPNLAEYATSRAGTIKIDATKTPRQMDAISPEKEVMLGIYELHGDNYKVCFAPAGKPRPNELTSKPGSGYILQVWVRQKTQ
jgi:uncharacterized protein (TIGR03067 family)